VVHDCGLLQICHSLRLIAPLHSDGQVCRRRAPFRRFTLNPPLRTTKRPIRFLCHDMMTLSSSECSLSPIQTSVSLSRLDNRASTHSIDCTRMASSISRCRGRMKRRRSLPVSNLTTWICTHACEQPRLDRRALRGTRSNTPNAEVLQPGCRVLQVYMADPDAFRCKDLEIVKCACSQWWHVVLLCLWAMKWTFGRYGRGWGVEVE
jgi:hypothetical protein